MTSWTETNENSTSWTQQTKNTTTFTSLDEALEFFYLLLENGSKILKEDSGRLVLDDGHNTSFTFQTKN